MYPVLGLLPPHTRHKLSREHWAQLVERSKRESLRQLAHSYGLSHEAVRVALRAAASLPSWWGCKVDERCDEHAKPFCVTVLH